MRIGILHTYALDGSGSSTYVADLATHLALRGNEVHIISAEREPGRHEMFRAAYSYRDGSKERLVFKNHSGSCYSHGLMLPIAPVAYRRPGFPQGKPFTMLTDQEIREYIILSCSIISRICRKHRLDLLHANHALLMPYVASVVKSMEGVPYVATVHGSTIEYGLRRDPRYWPYAIEGLKRADRVIASHYEVISRILEISPDLRSTVVEIPPGVDTSKFVPIAARDRHSLVDRLVHDDSPTRCTEGTPEIAYDLLDPILEEGGDSGQVMQKLSRIGAGRDSSGPDSDLARKLALIERHGGPLILYSGPLRFDKGVHCLIAAFPHVLQRSPGCRLVVAGDGDDREYLEAAVCALDCGDVDLFEQVLHLGAVERGSGGPEAHSYVRDFLRAGDRKAYADMSRGRMKDGVIFTGNLSRSQLSRLLGCASVGIVPSIMNEEFPPGFLEALSCGALPVAPYHAGLRPVLDKLERELGDIGRLCRVNHHPEAMVRDLAAKVSEILLLLTDENLRRQIGARCHRLADSEYSWDVAASRTEAVYSACLDRNSAPVLAEIGS